jgi:serine/threonine-protein kinase PknG
VLCTDFRGYQSTYRYSLPPQDDVPLYQRFDSLYRFLERGCAHHPADRFHSAEEMGGQLLGVLREVVATTTGCPAPGPSTQFTGEGRGAIDRPDIRALPSPLANTEDPATALLLSLGAVDADELAALVENAPERSVELELRLVRTLIDEDRITEAESVLGGLERDNPGDWRTHWYRALASMSVSEHDVAAAQFSHVHRALPGELAPKVGLAFAAESAGDHVGATRWYDVAVRTDPSIVAAVFGLARCRRACGDRDGAIAAYDRIAHTSSLHTEAKVAQIEAMLGDRGDDVTMADVRAAAAITEELPLEREQRGRLSASILSAALVRLHDDPTAADASALLLGCELTENGVRRGLEATYRQLARLAPSLPHRVVLVERANHIRPRSLL